MNRTLTALTILASADGIKSAVAQLTANGFTPIFRGSNFSDGWYELPELNFWIFRGRIYVNVHANPASTLATVALKFHAQQQDSATQVPASASPVVEHPDNFYCSCPKCGKQTPCYIVGLYGHCKPCQYPLIPEQSTESVDKTSSRSVLWVNPKRGWSVKTYPKAGGAA